MIFGFGQMHLISRLQAHIRQLIHHSCFFWQLRWAGSSIHITQLLFKISHNCTMPQNRSKVAKTSFSKSYMGSLFLYFFIDYNYQVCQRWHGIEVKRTTSKKKDFKGVKRIFSEVYNDQTTDNFGRTPIKNWHACLKKAINNTVKK